jgi:hypothetical protein
VPVIGFLQGYQQELGRCDPQEIRRFEHAPSHWQRFRLTAIDNPLTCWWGDS